MQSNVLHVRHVNYQPKRHTHSSVTLPLTKMLSILDKVSANILLLPCPCSYIQACVWTQLNAVLNLYPNIYLEIHTLIV